jgi:hypothetical protein
VREQIMNDKPIKRAIKSFSEWTHKVNSHQIAWFIDDLTRWGQDRRMGALRQWARMKFPRIWVKKPIRKAPYTLLIYWVIDSSDGQMAKAKVPQFTWDSRQWRRGNQDKPTIVGNIHCKNTTRLTKKKETIRKWDCAIPTVKKTNWEDGALTPSPGQNRTLLSQIWPQEGGKIASPMPPTGRHSLEATQSRIIEMVKGYPSQIPASGCGCPLPPEILADICPYRRPWEGHRLWETK